MKTDVNQVREALERYMGKFGDCGDTYAEAKQALHILDGKVLVGGETRKLLIDLVGAVKRKRSIQNNLKLIDFLQDYKKLDRAIHEIECIAYELADMFDSGSGPKMYVSLQPREEDEMQPEGMISFEEWYKELQMLADRAGLHGIVGDAESHRDAYDDGDSPDVELDNLISCL